MSAITKWVPKEDWLLVAMATVLCSMAMVYIFLNDPLRRLGEATVVGELTTEGTIRRRRAGLLVWENLRDSSSLYLRDTLVSPPDATGTITLNNGTVIDLEPNSMLQLKEVLKHNFEATVFYGGAKKKKGSRLGKRVALAVREKKKPLAVIRKVAMKPLLISMVGELPPLDSLVELQKGYDQNFNRLLDVKSNRVALKQVRFSDRTSKLNGLKYFQIDFDLPGRSRVLEMRRNQWLRLNWSSIPLKGVKYTVEFSETPSFKSRVKHKTSNPNLALQLTTTGRYYVRVRARVLKKRITSKPIEVRITR